MHIAGNPASLSPQQRELVAIAARVGQQVLAPQAAQHDREASFPLQSMAALREAGLLAVGVPREHGGLGGDFATCALVAAELGRYCGATALSFNMHMSCTLWAGLVADALPMSSAQRAEHGEHRALHFANVVQRGLLYSQPFSEGGAAAAGKAPWGTVARPVDGGYVVTGRKIFASLSGAADFHGVLCTLDKPGAGLHDALFLAVPATAEGVAVTGEWDALGMRGTASRTLVLQEVFVPHSARLLPEGLAWQAAERYPHMVASLASPYMGIAQAAYDFSVAYLRGEVPGMAPVKRRMYPTKQADVAQMRLLLEQTRALFLQNARDACLDPEPDTRQRLLAAHYTVMENASAIASLAVRTCGGQALAKTLPLERLFRDSRCGSLMLPWTAELCIDHLGRECLYGQGESDECID